MLSAGFVFADVPDPGHAHPLLVQALPQAAKNGAMHTSGRLRGSQRLDLAIHLPARNQSDLDELIRELYDPASPNYHNYLSVDEFTARFGPTQADYDEVVAWANAQGLTVTRTTPNRHLIDVSATVDDINRALNVVMNAYQGGRRRQESVLRAGSRTERESRRTDSADHRSRQLQPAAVAASSEWSRGESERVRSGRRVPAERHARCVLRFRTAHAARGKPSAYSRSTATSRPTSPRTIRCFTSHRPMFR